MPDPGAAAIARAGIAAGRARRTPCLPPLANGLSRVSSLPCQDVMVQREPAAASSLFCALHRLLRQAAAGARSCRSMATTIAQRHRCCHNAMNERVDVARPTLPNTMQGCARKSPGCWTAPLRGRCPHQRLRKWLVLPTDSPDYETLSCSPKGGSAGTRAMPLRIAPTRLTHASIARPGRRQRPTPPSGSSREKPRSIRTGATATNWRAHRPPWSPSRLPADRSAWDAP